MRIEGPAWRRSSGAHDPLAAEGRVVTYDGISAMAENFTGPTRAETNPEVHDE